MAPNMKTSFSGVLKQLLQMNTQWLKEQESILSPPPAVIKGAAPLSQTYESYESYASRLRSMILLEIWQQLFMESSQVRASGRRHKMFYFAVLSHVVKGELLELECESVVDSTVSFGPREGTMALLELREGPNQCNPSFGYVFRHSTHPLQPGAAREGKWKDLHHVWSPKANLWTFSACVKRKREVAYFDSDTLMRGNGLGYVRGRLSWANALHAFQRSPLLEGVLRPQEKTFPKKSKHNNAATTDPDYTRVQSRFIACVRGEILGAEEGATAVVLLKGGPGTGKTHAIVGLLESMFYRRGVSAEPKHRVVVAAPSDSALDEIGRRLIRLGRRYERKGGGKVKFVRVGVEGYVSRWMVPHLVTSLARKLRKALAPSDARTDSSLRTEVLLASHIILSPLSSCTDLSFVPSCCVVDDAAQCTELDTLQAISLLSPRLVLAGDPSQRRPEVLSWQAERLGLGRSLFERMLARHPEKAFDLDTQFRMHPEIARFPYPSLANHPQPLHADDCPFRPYLFVDLPPDVLVVTSVCGFICANDSRSSVGLIASPQERAKSLRSHRNRIEVRAPDGFLGREMDVVIVWADIACPRLLNSALTRASKCLIVCAQSDKVDCYPHWRALMDDARNRRLYATIRSPEHVTNVLQHYLLKGSYIRCFPK